MRKGPGWEPYIRYAISATAAVMNRLSHAMSASERRFTA